MTNDLKNFLEEKLKEVEDNTNLLRGLPNDDEALDLIMKTYIEISNFVLDLVEKEVETELGTEFDRAFDKVSTIINNLKV